MVAGKLQFAENAGTLQADGSAAGIVVSSGRPTRCVERIAVARIVVPGHQHNALGTLRISPLQHRINIGDYGEAEECGQQGPSVKLSVFTSRQPPQSRE